jgi:basic membrane protein A and related proteins
MKRFALLLSVAVASLVLLGGAVGGTKPVRVLFVTDLLRPATKHDFRGIAYLGFLRAVKDFGIQGRVVQIDPYQQAAQKLSAFARQNYDLIYTGTLLPDDVDAVARKFPQTKFLYPFEFQFLRHRPKNVEGFDVRDGEAAYLAGYLAGKVESLRPGKHVISSVGGWPVQPVNALIAGFEAGARKADATIKTVRGYSNDWIAAPKCKAVALSQIVAGSGIVFDVAGACGLGALEAAKDKGVWGVGVDVDQSFLGPHILTSEVSQIDVIVYSELRAFVRGTLKTGGNSLWDLANGGVGLGKISPKVPRRFVRELRAIQAEIVAGKIKVPTALM